MGLYYNAGASSSKGAAAEAGTNNPKATSSRTPVGSASSSSLKAAGLLDPNRALQAINAETLEAASAMADYVIPPITTQVSPGSVTAADQSLAAKHQVAEMCILMWGSKIPGRSTHI